MPDCMSVSQTVSEYLCAWTLPREHIWRILSFLVPSFEPKPTLRMIQTMIHFGTAKTGGLSAIQNFIDNNLQIKQICYVDISASNWAACSYMDFSIQSPNRHIANIQNGNIFFIKKTIFWILHCSIFIKTKDELCLFR